MPNLLKLPPLLLALTLAGCGGGESGTAPGTAEGADPGLSAEEMTAAAGAGWEDPAAPAATPRELEWDALIPEDWRPEAIFADYPVDELADDDPRAQELMERLEALWAEAPVVEALDGETVRLPGFVVPLETGTGEIREFLLVPYYGACIHVPPPPANQTVHVLASPDGAIELGLFDTVHVTGVLEVAPVDTALAEAGYTIRGARVEPFR